VVVATDGRWQLLFQLWEQLDGVGRCQLFLHLGEQLGHCFCMLIIQSNHFKLKLIV